MSDQQQYRVVGVHGAPTPETAPHGVRWRISKMTQWISSSGPYEWQPWNEWYPLPPPPTEQAPAPEPEKRWTVSSSSISGSGGWLRVDGRVVTYGEAKEVADALNDLDAHGVAWGSGRPMEELPDGNHSRVLMRADGGSYIASNTYRSTDAIHKRACWWPLPGPLPGVTT